MPSAEFSDTDIGSEKSDEDTSVDAFAEAAMETLIKTFENVSEKISRNAVRILIGFDLLEMPCFMEIPLFCSSCFWLFRYDIITHPI